MYDEVFSVGRRILSDRWSLCHLQQKLFKEHSSSNEIVTFQRKLEYISNFKFSRMDVESWAYNSFQTQSVSQAQLSVSGSWLCADFEDGNKVAENINLSNFQILITKPKIYVEWPQQQSELILLPCYWPSNYQLPGGIDGFTYFYQLQQRLGIIIFALWSVIGKKWHHFPVFIFGLWNLTSDEQS